MGSKLLLGDRHARESLLSACSLPQGNYPVGPLRKMSLAGTHMPPDVSIVEFLRRVGQANPTSMDSSVSGMFRPSCQKLTDAEVRSFSE